MLFGYRAYLKTELAMMKSRRLVLGREEAVLLTKDVKFYKRKSNSAILMRHFDDPAIGTMRMSTHNNRSSFTTQNRHARLHKASSARRSFF